VALDGQHRARSRQHDRSNFDTLLAVYTGAFGSLVSVA
jgi:hypothetical protein